jgi:hypothetical protein
MAGRALGLVVALAAALALAAGNAVAAPPTEPPGKSGEAPGQLKKDEHDKQQEQASAPAPAVEVAPAPAPAEGAAAAAPSDSQPAESPRYENAAGKPKRNVPAAAEAAPETSVSEPGHSGRHKLTICHKGHAITVDVHAARAHVDGHGDTYAPAGSKGRAACPQPSSVPPSPPGPADTSGPPAQDDDAPAGARTADPTTRPALVEDPAVAPAGPKDPAGGVTAVTSTSRAGGVAAEVSGDTLPFTGGRLPVLASLGFALLALGAVLLAAARRPAPAPSRRC